MREWFDRHGRDGPPFHQKGSASVAGRQAGRARAAGFFSIVDLAFGQWWNPAMFYPAGLPANYFAKFWHDHSLNGLAYGFAYDDVGAHSPSIHTPKPVSVTYTIGW